MKRFLTLCLLAVTMCAMAQTKKVAVYVTGEQNGISKVLGDQLVAGFTQSGKYVAVERTSGFLSELNKEHAYQQNGAVDDREISRVGKQFGVQLVCVADISDLFGEKYISTRLIDVESAEVVNTANQQSRLSNMDEVISTSQSLAMQLAGKTAAERYQDQLIEKQQKEAAEQEKQERQQRIKNAGYVDLGLPSGKCWKVVTSAWEYDYIERNTASPEDWMEMQYYCRTRWIGSGLLVYSKDDSSQTLLLPAKGYIPNGNSSYVNVSIGYFWTNNTNEFVTISSSGISIAHKTTNPHDQLFNCVVQTF